MTRPKSLGDMTPVVATIASNRREGEGVVTLDVFPPSDDGFAFLPGQFNMMTVFGVGEVPISISGDPGAPHQVIHTIRDVGAVSHALCGLQPGDQIGLRGPFGAPWPVQEARGKDVLFIAGGLGLAPLRPAIYHVLAHRTDYGRVTLVYGARSPSAILYPDALTDWAARSDIEVRVTVDHAGVDWKGRVGFVTQLLPGITPDPADTRAMICGPEVMMRSSAVALEMQGMAPDAIYLSMERNMKCAVRLCGHCQFGPYFICKDGPVLSFDRLKPLLTIKEA